MANCMLFGQRAAILFDQAAVRLRHGLRCAGVQSIIRLLLAQGIGGGPFGTLERGGHLHLQFVPLREILLPRLGARRGASRVEAVGLAGKTLEPVFPLHFGEQLAGVLPGFLGIAALHAATLDARPRCLTAAPSGAAPAFELLAHAGELAIELRQFFSKLANTREFLGQSFRIRTLPAGGAKTIANAFERPRDLLGGRRPTSRAAAGRTRLPGARGVPHLLGRTLLVDFTNCLAQGVALARVTSLRRVGQLPHALLQPFGAVGKAFLLRGLPSRPIGGIAALAPTGLTAQPSLGFGELARLELHFAERAAAVVRLGASQALLQISKPLGGTAAAGAGLSGIVAPQFARGALHVLGDLLQLAAGLLTVALPILTRLTGLLATTLTAALTGLLALLPLAALLLLTLLPLASLVRLAPLLLLLKLTRKFLGLPAEFALLAGQPLELTLQLLGVRLLAIPGQFLLALVQGILSPREFLDFLEGIVLPRAFVASLRATGRLVVRLLLPGEFAVEQRRHVLLLTVGTAAALAVRLLLNLAPPHFSLRAQQLVQRVHLLRQGVGGLEPLELLTGALHRFHRTGDRLDHEIGTGWRRRPTPADRVAAPEIGRAPHLPERGHRSRAQFALGLLDSADVVVRSAAGFTTSPIEIPGRGDDVFLFLDQIFQRT